MKALSIYSSAVRTFIVAAFVFSIFPVEAKLSRAQIKREEKKLERKHNKNDSGAGVILVQNKLKAFYKNALRKAKTRRCEKQAERKIAKTENTIKRLKKRRNLYSFRGRWDVDNETGGEFVYHFASHSSSDSVILEVLDRGTLDLLYVVSGYQKFEVFKGTDSSLALRYTLRSSEPTKRPGTPTLSGSEVDRAPGGGTKRISGTRTASPFD